MIWITVIHPRFGYGVRCVSTAFSPGGSPSGLPLASPSVKINGAEVPQSKVKMNKWAATIFLTRLVSSFYWVVMMLVVTANANGGVEQNLRPEMATSPSRDQELRNYSLAGTKNDDKPPAWSNYLNHPTIAARIPAYTGYAIGGMCGFVMGFLVAPLNSGAEFATRHDLISAGPDLNPHSHTPGEPELSSFSAVIILIVGIVRWPVDGFVVGAEVAENGADIGQACAGSSFVTLKSWVWDTPLGWFTRGDGTRLAGDAP